MRLLSYIGAAEETVAIVTALTFLVLYTRWYQWWKSSLGRAIAGLDMALILALIPGQLRVWLHLRDSVALSVVVLVALGLVPVVTFSRIVVIWRDHRATKSPGYYLADSPADEQAAKKRGRRRNGRDCVSLLIPAVAVSALLFPGHHATPPRPAASHQLVRVPARRDAVERLPAK